jgi:ribonuclease P protein component
MKPFGFPKNERLCSKKSIEAIFSHGISAFSYPLKAVYIIEPAELLHPSSQSLFVVPKKKFKRAVDRNAIRRRTRECFRLNKHLLLDWCLANQCQIKIAFIYIASNQYEFSVIEKAVIKIYSEITGSQSNCKQTELHK